MSRKIIDGSVKDYVDDKILSDAQPLDATLTSLAGYNTNGLLTQTASDTFTGRTLTGTASKITVTNGDGVSGNPTITIPDTPTLVTPTIADFTNATHSHQNNAGGGTLDHGLALTGLADDDHTQYALLAGRAGGQVLIGGTANTDHLDLKGNSNAFAWTHTSRIRPFQPMDFSQITATLTGSQLNVVNFSPTITTTGLNAPIIIGFYHSPIVARDTSTSLALAPAFWGQGVDRITAGGLADNALHVPTSFLATNWLDIAHSGSAGTSSGEMMGVGSAPRVVRSSGTGTHTTTRVSAYTANTSLFLVKQINTGHTVTTFSGLHVLNPVNDGGTVTTNIGVDIDAMTTGTTDIGIRIALADTYSLQLSSTAGTPASGITFGTDTNLYRSSANVLKTDDSLEVVDEAYGSSWNGSLQVPTKNAVYDKIELVNKKTVSIQVNEGTADASVADGHAYFTIPTTLNGMNLVRAQATVVTAGTTGATTVMVHNKTQTADMLSGAISIASGGTVGTVGTIDTSNDDVATDDVIRIDVDSVSTTAPKGLMVVLEFALP